MHVLSTFRDTFEKGNNRGQFRCGWNIEISWRDFAFSSRIAKNCDQKSFKTWLHRARNITALTNSAKTVDLYGQMLLTRSKFWPQREVTAVLKRPIENKHWPQMSSLRFSQKSWFFDCNDILNKFCISLAAKWIKANANLFRTKSLLLRSSSINLLRNCLQPTRKLFTFRVHNFKNVISKHIQRKETEKNVLSTRISFNTAPVDRTQFTVFHYWIVSCCCWCIYHLAKGLKLIIECMHIKLAGAAPSVTIDADFVALDCLHTFCFLAASRSELCVAL